ncbi:hypothetical protein KIH79_03125 [Bifidobacterium sp. 82T10]|uniref:Alpha-L-arabinofuranosidase C-terminal domain-containing protein n=1 Tax=Bifidobacterium miconis TaxID=2834435 RepID=A0ABS6WD25_9BIFI|nr:alpha-L-arabinofuranosidase C-terminal domain-containing protein [Bifidobacterium miconis]MBW3091961.1 hypothetical protein [Bifidobacterium miconis]
MTQRNAAPEPSKQAATERVPITVDVRDTPIKNQGDLFGVFFEDLNHAADGGLYGELVRNRSFEFDPIDNASYTALTAWRKVQRGDAIVGLHVDDAHPLNERNRHYARLDVIRCGDGAGISNLGYGDGIPVRDGEKYRFSCQVRLDGSPAHGNARTDRNNNDEPISIIVWLENADGTETYGETVLPIPAEAYGAWTRVEGTVTAFISGRDGERAGAGMQNDGDDRRRANADADDRVDPAGRLTLMFDAPCHVSLDMVSLFPARTFRNRPNGMRRDVAQLIADMKPKFMRFPGGCVMHIGSLDADDRDSIYRWKNTVGPVEQRPARRNSWNYNSTFGLGYFEFFQFCEDIGAEPLPVIAGGWDPHNLEATPIEDMQEWVDEVLDLIEFANGPADSRWGSVRASMGHPGSFRLKYLGIGNEETGSEFYERYDIMAKAVRERYPDIRLIGSAGPSIGGEQEAQIWADAAKTGTSFMDEHFYHSPEWFVANVDRYASYRADEGWPRAFLGEYASCGKAWRNALAEAAFLTGVEKAPGIGLACYAPMLCNVAYRNWDPDMIYFDGTRAFGTPSYWVQRMFMTGQGTQLLAASDDMPTPTTEPEPLSLAGLLRMTTTHARVDVAGFTVRDENGDVLLRDDDFTIDADHAIRDCGSVPADSYTVEFTFTRRNGELRDELNGKYGFGLDFAMHDDRNLLRFYINGWQRLCGLHGVTNGGLCTTNSHVVTERGVAYRCRLSVDGSRVRGWIDDTPIFDHTFKRSDPRPLYYSAVRDETTGETIVKLVNVTDASQPVAVRFPHADDTAADGDSPADGHRCAGARQAVVESIADVPLDAENDFDAPERVRPHTRLVGIDADGTVSLTVGPHSFHMLRVR